MAFHHEGRAGSLPGARALTGSDCSTWLTGKGSINPGDTPAYSKRQAPAIKSLIAGYPLGAGSDGNGRDGTETENKSRFVRTGSTEFRCLSMALKGKGLGNYYHA
jgi:hypothetical protein